jgi:hypothetical protein
MSRLLRLLLVATLGLGGLGLVGAAPAAAGGAINDSGGDISSDTNNSGESMSGDAVAGQVVGVVSAGDTSVDSTNRSEDVDVETGDAEAFNQSEVDAEQFNNTGGENELEDGADISSDITQAANATSGDGVGGQVIGVVTSAGGSADVVAANNSEDVDIETGDAFADNVLDVSAAQFNVESTGNNEADGDISGEFSQQATTASGDGVGGQVLGVVSAGDTSVDATNESTDVDIETGESESFNFVDSIVGQDTAGDGGDNELEDGAEISGEFDQVAESTSGDGVGGQVIGAVTSAGGSADVVAANTSEDVDVETGDTFADNFVDVGNVGQFTFADGNNDADDDISGEFGQSATAASGDGVGGQVLGIVSAGDASVDATNESTDVDVETGLASSDNFIDSFVGQSVDDGGTGDNFSDGEIESSLIQASTAGSGDAVAGQVAGIVTSAGGTADLVLANTSEDADPESGDAFMFNEDVEFVGQELVGEL